MRRKLNILFLCTGNSCRSQLAEGWTHHLKGGLINCRSAGIETHGLNPLAVKAMAEAEATEEGAMAHYRRVLDEIRAFVESLPESLPNNPKPNGIES